MWATIGKGRVWREDIKNKAKDGSVYWVDTTIIPSKDDKGRPNKYLSIRFDITEAKTNSILIEDNHREAIVYQIRLLAAQLNPNFVYTSMNSLQYAILDENIENAVNFTAGFTNILRTITENSLSLYISIEQEIDFLHKFLAFEQERNKGLFIYKIVAEDIDTKHTFIPPMIIQPYLENSIIHGFSS